MKSFDYFPISRMLFLLLCFSGLSACSAIRKPPAVRTFPSPAVTVNTDAFEQAGCSIDDSGRMGCPPESLLGKLGCDYISTPGDYLGGLQPNVPINLCWKIGSGGQFLSADQYVYRDGCLLPLFARYVIYKDSQFILVENLHDLHKTFAPITSADEAMSYAIAATGLAAYYGLEPQKGFRYFVDRLEDSHVETVKNGYLVYLYDYKLCGCGPHTTSFVVVLIKPDGTVEEMSRIPVFEDPEQDNLCID